MRLASSLPADAQSSAPAEACSSGASVIPPPHFESAVPAGTAYHAKYFAYALTLLGGENADRLRQSLLNASVDLNPHQVQAALFALRSPLSKGVLLADEVGLGKTIEAGLVLCQLWAERKRKLIVICPASLRKQWQIELSEKFNLPSEILDAQRFRALLRKGIAEPFSVPSVIITSYNYAAKMKDAIKVVPWDCVVIDECHKLRNAYRESSRIGQALLWALEDRRKILLSATPLQNNLTELYGVATLIDSTLFGDLPSFRSRYANAGGDFNGLRERLKDFCRRTLRKDVREYVRYTERLPITTPFQSSDAEFSLYQDVSAYLQDETAYAFPQGQRHMLTLSIRKLLASSPAALIGTLEKVLSRLRDLQKNRANCDDDESILDRILEGEEDLLDEALEDEEDETLDTEGSGYDSVPVAETAPDAARLAREISRVEDFIARARAIGDDSKTRGLVKALHEGFAKLEEIGAEKKSVVFTESRRSMRFLKKFLEANGYAGKVVCFSGGGNDDPDAEAIYRKYAEEHPDAIEGKTVMMRHALIEHFRDEAQILIATEAGAEGINLQFCSMVVNYDLPWNPQRVEQRIGRCHRYGQKFNVVVVNFLNKRNAADVRVFELLNEKLKLFEGIFGASNDVLGIVDQSGISFEKRIHAILQKCRTAEEIQAAFDALQSECEEKIDAQMRETKKEILENLDVEVVKRLHMDYDDAKSCLDTHSRRFWELTKYVLREHARFDDATLSFTLDTSPFPDTPGILPGLYTFSKKEDAAGTPYRPNSPLGEQVVAAAKNLRTPLAEIAFDISRYPGKISVLEQLKGRNGFLLLNRLRLKSLDAEDFLLFSAVTEEGEVVDHEIAQQLFALAGIVVPAESIPNALEKKLLANAAQFAKATASKVGEKNNEMFKLETEKLERWCDDQVSVATHKIDMLKMKKREIEREIRQAPTVDEQMRLQKDLDKNKSDIRRARREVEAVEDEADEKRSRLLDALQRKLVPATETETLFTIRWRVV